MDRKMKNILGILFFSSLTLVSCTPTTALPSTSTSTPTRASTITPTTQAVSILLYDDFSDPDSGWSVFSDRQSAEVGYQEDVFRIAFYTPGGFQASWSPDEYDDFLVETQFSVAQGTNVGGGLTLRAASHRWYLIFIYPNTQEYVFWKDIDGNTIQLIERQYSSAIQPEQIKGALHLRLKVAAQQDVFEIWISSPNEDYVLLDSVSDSRLTQGHLGPAAIPPDGSFSPPQEVLFDWIQISEIEVQPDISEGMMEPMDQTTQGWVQSNLDGFGNVDNVSVFSLGKLDNQLYAGTRNSVTGAEIWRLEEEVWVQVMEGGFGSPSNLAIDHLLEYKGQVYASTWNQYSDTASYGSEIWRSQDGENWSQVVSGGFGNPNNGEITLGEFNDRLYAGTWSFDPTTSPAEIWASTSGNSEDWSRLTDTNIMTGNEGVICFGKYNGNLYAGTANTTSGAEIWRTQDGAHWELAAVNGLGDKSNYSVTALAEFGGYLYAALGTSWDAPRAQLWRCEQCEGNDWVLVKSGDFYHPDTWRKASLEVFNGYLYYVVGNQEQGLEVWRTTNGLDWEMESMEGFGDTNNIYTYFDNATLVFDQRLFIGTNNTVSGGEVWQISTP